MFQKTNNELGTAVARGNLDTIRQILAHDPDPNIDGGRQIPVIQIAAEYGHWDVFQFLVAAGADIHLPRGEWGSTINAAIAGGSVDIVTYLLACGAEVDFGSAETSGWLQKLEHSEMIDFLLAHGSDVNVCHKNLGTPLQRAAEEGNLRFVQRFLEHGAEIDKTPDQITPLMHAALNGHIEVVKALLDAGANPRAKSLSGRTPDEWALAKKHTEIAELIQRASPINQNV